MKKVSKIYVVMALALLGALVMGLILNGCGASSSSNVSAPTVLPQCGGSGTSCI